MPPASVRNWRSRQRLLRCGATALTRDTAGASPASPSGRRPIAWGLREMTRSATSQSTTIMTQPMTVAAPAKPSQPMAATQSGENNTPPTLAPL